MRKAVRVALVLSSALMASSVRAQSAATTPADVQKFMGTWALSLESPQGTFVLNFALKEKEGKLAGELTSDIAPPQDVTDITKSGDDLVLKYTGNFQGNEFDAKITITPTSDTAANVVFDVMNGQFVINGTGTKK